MMNEFWLEIFLKVLLVIAILMCIAGVGFCAVLTLYAFGVIT